MPDWTDPDLRNHVLDDTDQRIGNTFTINTTFVEKPNPIYNSYVKKNVNQGLSTIIFQAPDLEKIARYRDTLYDDAPTYTFGYTSNNKPMSDSYYSFGHTYLYQLILHINRIWNMFEYNGDVMPLINIPTRGQMQSLFRDLLMDKNYVSVREIRNQETLNEVIRRIIIESDTDYTLIELIASKLRLEHADIINRLNSPLYKKFLAKQLGEVMTQFGKKADPSEEATETFIVKCINLIQLYTRQ
jgi:hypothetical protein